MLNFISFPKGPAVSARVAAWRSCFPFPNRVNKDAASWQGGKGLREETSTQQHPPQSHLMCAAWSATALHMLQARLTSSHQAHTFPELIACPAKLLSVGLRQHLVVPWSRPHATSGFWG